VKKIKSNNQQMTAYRVVILFLLIFIVSCGNEQPTDEAEKPLTAEDTVTIAEWEALLEQRKGNNFENVSKEMIDFVFYIDGTQESMQRALEKYGADKTIRNHDMAYYELTDPKVVVDTDSTCYHLRCLTKKIVNNYTICWEDGKIISIVTGELENW